MDRRVALKSLIAASGALVALPGWANGWTASTLDHDPTAFNPAEGEIISSVADAIIPAGNSIGALSVGVDKFLQKLFDNCYETDVRSNISMQLTSLESAAQRSYQRSFITCDLQQRQALLLALSTSENKAEKDFFTLIKSETIRGFNTSKGVMTTYLHYKVAPGHYYGCVDVKS